MTETNGDASKTLRLDWKSLGPWGNGEAYHLLGGVASLWRQVTVRVEEWRL